MSIAEKSPAIVLVEHFDEHYYKVTVGEQNYYIPSVTTKLGIIDKPFLAKWRGDIGNREADMRSYEGAQRGKRLHWARETLLKGGAVIYDPWQNPVYTPDGIANLSVEHERLAILRTQDEMHTIHKFQKQFKALAPMVLGVEEKVFDIDQRDAGTIDAIYKIKEGDYMISGAKPIHLEEGIYIEDLKTGKSVDDNVWLQIAPYLVMYEKMHGVKCQGALITHTSSSLKTGIPGLKTMVRSRELLVSQDYHDYRHASHLWERENGGKSPDTLEFPSLIKL